MEKEHIHWKHADLKPFLNFTIIIFMYCADSPSSSLCWPPVSVVLPSCEHLQSWPCCWTSCPLSNSNQSACSKTKSTLTHQTINNPPRRLIGQPIIKYATENGTNKLETRDSSKAREGWVSFNLLVNSALWVSAARGPGSVLGGEGRRRSLPRGGHSLAEHVNTCYGEQH